MAVSPLSGGSRRRSQALQGLNQHAPHTAAGEVLLRVRVHGQGRAGLQHRLHDDRAPEARRRAREGEQQLASAAARTVGPPPDLRPEVAETLAVAGVHGVGPVLHGVALWQQTEAAVGPLGGRQ
eukprot:9476552-Heterocapsa_arctica.AAC.1